MSDRIAQDRERCGFSSRSADDWNLLFVGVNIIVNVLNTCWYGVLAEENTQLFLIGGESALAEEGDINEGGGGESHASQVLSCSTSWVARSGRGGRFYHPFED